MVIGAYTPRWHLRAGESVPVHVSTALPAYHARLLHLLGPIEGPDDWRNRTRLVDGVGGGPWKGTHHPARLGSCMVAECHRRDEAAFLLTIGVRPTFCRPDATILEMRFERERLRLVAGADDLLYLCEAIASRPDRLCATGLTLPLHRWCRLAVLVDVPRRSVELAVQFLETAAGPRQVQSFAARTEIASPLRRLVLAGIGVDGGFEGHFDGKIEHVVIKRGNIASAASAIAAGAGEVDAHWDLGQLPYDDASVPDLTGRWPAAALLNGPERAVTSSAWRGQSDDHRERPDLYAAASFHSDDLIDAGWPAAFVVRIPDDAPSGAYSLVLAADAAVDWGDRSSFYPVPLFVAPRPGEAAEVALVLPTLSYRAYANGTAYEQVDPRVFHLRRKTASEGVYDYARTVGLRSLYERHPDGSGVHLASLLRPQATIRPDFVSMLLGFPHQFSADLSIIGWLRSLGVGYDVLTDEVLHEDGAAALRPYKVVITGSHPEYATAEMLDAYAGHAGSGGALMYLGGNGFYWRTGIDSLRPHVIEVRRSEGVRTWTAAPGARRHQGDGRLGGLWRALGRPPNLLFGIGMAAVGFGADGHYRVPAGTPLGALPPRLREVLAEIGDQEFGIAGLELDCFDISQGSPADAIVIGAAAGLPPDFAPAIEEVPAIDALLPDPTQAMARLARGNVVLFRGRGGGLCFSAGSIRWASGLSDQNDARRVRAVTTAALLDLLSDGRAPGDWPEPGNTAEEGA